MSLGIVARAIVQLCGSRWTVTILTIFRPLILIVFKACEGTVLIGLEGIGGTIGFICLGLSLGLRGIVCASSGLARA